MKKFMMILVCVLACFSLFTGCTDQKGNDEQDTNLGNSVEIDDTDIEIDTEPGLDTEGVTKTSLKQDFQQQNHGCLKFCC